MTPNLPEQIQQYLDQLKAKDSAPPGSRTKVGPPAGPAGPAAGAGLSEALGPPAPALQNDGLGKTMGNIPEAAMDTRQYDLQDDGLGRTMEQMDPQRMRRRR